MSKLVIDRVGRTFPGVRAGRATEALQPTSLTVADNDFITILGPSGCGKSTLLRIIAGLDVPTTGGVRLGRVGLEGFEHHYPKMLSGGMQQRTAIARALANEPKILLLDEPFGALDNQTRSLMQELLLSIWETERKTVLFVTHDIEESIFMASRVVVMSARPGRIKADVPVPIAHPRHYTVKTSPEFSALKARLTEEIRVEALRTQVA